LRERRDLAGNVKDAHSPGYPGSPPANFLNRGPAADS
jgi:hypothetical protein